jgi:hypothetical protein
MGTIMGKYSWLFFCALVGIAAVNGCDSKEETVVAFNGDEKLPDGTFVPLQIFQNYPNPFNPTTMIHFGVAVEMRVSIKIYTEEWQEVSVLTDRLYTPGLYAMMFNATDLPSGSYYYVAEGGGYKEVRIMRLMK